MRNLTVVDASTSAAGAYCTRMFAAFGADVVVAEAPGGHPLRQAPPWITVGADGPVSAAWAYLAAGKRSVIADEAALDRLAATADLVVLSADGDPDTATEIGRAHV